MELIFRCISSVSYLIRVNQSIYGRIIPKRGLRQGDPLSPYLFVICAQGLSKIFSKATNDKWFHGVKISATCPSISHLVFADDSLFFSVLQNQIAFVLNGVCKFMKKLQASW